MHFGKLKPGDVVPPDLLSQARRGLLGPEIPSEWNALMVPSMREDRCRLWLESVGVFSFFPTQVRKHKRRGKEFERRYPLIGGIVYARFRNRPNWDVMRDMRLITGFFQRPDEQPVKIDRETIRRLQGLESAAERIARLKREANLVRKGDRAVLLGGAFEGWPVVVDEVRGNRVFCAMAGQVSARVETTQSNLAKQNA
ncbi:MAG: hypothetical protein AAGK66_06125 [Pseudomonadota bacterium]